jgi:hypothetical protein
LRDANEAFVNSKEEEEEEALIEGKRKREALR